MFLSWGFDPQKEAINSSKNNLKTSQQNKSAPITLKPLYQQQTKHRSYKQTQVYDYKSHFSHKNDNFIFIACYFFVKIVHSDTIICFLISNNCEGAEACVHKDDAPNYNIWIRVYIFSYKQLAV